MKRQRRIFSESFKREKVKLIDENRLLVKSNWNKTII